MFDLWHIAAHALWIFGLAVLLSVWSFGYYEAQQSGKPVLSFLSKPTYHLGLTVGLVLVFAGLVGVDGRLWARIIWGILLVGAIAWFIYRRRTVQ
jgi:hypothetical protein